MGGFMSAFKTKEAASVVLDFENATPSPGEEGVYERIHAVLSKAPDMLHSVTHYHSCQELVQKAISAPSEENQRACWEALQPTIAALRDYFVYTEDLKTVVPELMRALCDGGSKLESQHALARQLGDLLDFVIRFDHVKMNTPDMQNDFSYYRRSMQRMKVNQQQAQDGTISDEDANRMSLFYASHTPTMTVVLAAVTDFVNSPANNVSLANITESLSIMASSTRDMIRNKQFESAETNLFCLRTMVSSIILFDQLDNAGAFCKKSPINITKCVQVLREWPDAEERVSLANMLRFTNRHLKEDTALPGIADQLNAAAEGGSNNNNN